MVHFMTPFFANHLPICQFESARIKAKWSKENSTNHGVCIRGINFSGVISLYLFSFSSSFVVKCNGWHSRVLQNLKKVAQASTNMLSFLTVSNIAIGKKIKQAYSLGISQGHHFWFYT